MRSRLDYPGRVAATATAAAAAAAAVAFVVGALLATRAAAAPPSPRKNAAAEKKKKKKKNASGFSFVKRIILVRHGESLGNADHSAYQRIGDNVIPLTETGLAQARARGRAIRARGEIKGVFRVYYSPYLRARQTALEVVRGICGGDERPWNSTERLAASRKDASPPRTVMRGEMRFRAGVAAEEERVGPRVQ